MDPESKKLLEETYRLTEENNHMLRKVRNVQRWSVFWSSLKIVLVIGIALGLFYFLEPYIEKMISLYNSVSGTTGNMNYNSSSFQDLLKKF
ncbi:MAG: hypothetical protein WCW93_00900 [Candidatus Paceibacterota bacterium]